MNSLLAYLATAAVCVSAVIIWRAQRALRHTTLTSAGRWAQVGISAWFIVSVAASISAGESAGWLNAASYATALLMLCPALAVLGARRPTVRVWNWFVILPFLLVFSWPIAAAARELSHGGPFALETPMLLGFAFVVVMGLGNYFGTRFTLPAIGAAMSLLLLALPAADFRISWLPRADLSRSFASLLMSAVLCGACIAAKRPFTVRVPLDQVWIEFRDQFGVVWSKRILERLNSMAEKDALSVRMSVTGVVSVSGADAHPDAASVDELEKSLRWLLRRFVDEGWIDSQLSRSHLSDAAHSG